MQFLFQHPTASSTDVDAFPRSRLDINAERDIVIGRVANAVAGGRATLIIMPAVNISLARGHFCPRAPVCMSQANNSSSAALCKEDISALNSSTWTNRLVEKVSVDFSPAAQN